MRPTTDDAVSKRTEYLLYALIAILYIFLIGRYNAFDLDSRWFPSFSHAFVIDHIQTDPFAQGQFPNGMGGVIAFGKLAAIVQGSLLSIIGWSLGAATSISIVFILVSLFLLARAARRTGFSPNFTLCLITLMGFTEPFVAASQRTRYEFFAVFLLSLALYLAADNKIVLSMFIAALATEVEPAAVVIGLSIATFLFVANRKSRSLSTPLLFLRILAGAALSAGVYFVLHPHTISLFRSSHVTNISTGGTHIIGGFVAAYYVVYARHLPELAVILIAIARCIATSKRHLLFDWPALCAAVMIVASAILHWPQSAYFAFIAPFLGFFILQVFFTERRRNLIVAAVLLFTLPQYIHRYKLWSLQTPGFSQRDERQVDAAITRAAAKLNKPPSQLNILGDYALWFAHPHLFVNLNKRVVNPTTLHHADLILCLDQPFDPTAHITEEVLCGDLNPTDYRPIDQLTLNRRTIQLLIRAQAADK